MLRCRVPAGPRSAGPGRSRTEKDQRPGHAALLLLMPTILLLLQIQAQAPVEGPGLFTSFTQSGPVAKLVLAILILFSLISWAVLLGKLRQLGRAERDSREFLEIFHRSQKFSEVNA